MKDTIFISHANPEDNYFAAWLASKLNVLGYNAWVDVEDFNTGDAFFTKIQPIIRDQSNRFIAVNSNTYIQKSKNQNTGVSRELNTAITVTDIENFILPIRLDDASYSDFPSHYVNWNAIDFFGNWQLGLIELVKQLEKFGVPKNSQVNDPVETWFKTIKNENLVLERKEHYYSNWFPMELPDQIYIITPEVTSKELYNVIPYPMVLEANRIITFASPQSVSEYCEIINHVSKDIKLFINEDKLEIDHAFTLVEPRKKLIRLLNGCLNKHLSKSNLSYWRKRNLSYFERIEGNSAAVSLKRRFGKGSRMLVGGKTVQIRGKRKFINWHYAINPRAELFPFPHVRFFYTLIFTNEEGKGLGNETSRTLRRSVPADWYNRKWFEMLLASAVGLSKTEDNQHIEIEIDKDVYLKIENQPVGGEINVGYIEP